MTNGPKPKRRWFQFSLRTLLFAMFGCAVVLGLTARLGLANALFWLVVIGCVIMLCGALLDSVRIVTVGAALVGAPLLLFVVALVLHW